MPANKATITKIKGIKGGDRWGVKRGKTGKDPYKKEKEEEIQKFFPLFWKSCIIHERGFEFWWSTKMFLQRECISTLWRER